MVFGSGCLRVSDNMIPAQDIAEHVGCSEEVAREWLFKLEDEGELDTMPKGNMGIVWAKKTN
jgi:DNA-binding GntR family transcriptional regulator